MSNPVQTSYSRYFKQRLPGQESDTGRTYKREGTNQSGAVLDVGLALIADGSTDTGVTLPSTSAQRLVGISLNDYGRNPNGLTVDSNGQTSGYGTLRMLPVLCEGPVTVQIDQNCGPNDSPANDVYVRYAASTNGNTGVVGSFRADADGVAAVVTATPTAADTTLFRLLVFVDERAYSFEVNSGSGSSATSICGLFRTAMAADAGFSQRVTASGTATLILTNNRQNEKLVVSSSGSAGTIAVALTTAPSGTARRVRSARWLSSGTAAVGIGEIYFSATEENR